MLLLWSTVYIFKGQRRYSWLCKRIRSYCYYNSSHVRGTLCLPCLQCRWFLMSANKDILVPMVQLARSSKKEAFINLFARGRIIAYQPWWPTHARRPKANSNSCRDSTLQPLSGPCNSSWGPDCTHGPSRAERDRSVTEVEG